MTFIFIFIGMSILMSNLTKYQPGNRLVDCDECGFTYRFREMRRGVMGHQAGLKICPECYDPIHPREKTPVLRPAQPLQEVK
jgi:hypothetical protein